LSGYETPHASRTLVAEALAKARRADLLLVVLSAVNAAREPDRLILTQLRDHFAAQPALSPPPIVVALTHIDLLRPRQEWTPPYNIASPDTAKARAIRGAVEAVSAALQLPREAIVPVCLLPERLYNIEEALVPFLIQALPEAKRALLLRSLKTLRDQEEWELLGRQAFTTGRLLLQLGAEVVTKSLEQMLAQGKRR
jgi:predicted GTPase